MSESQPNMQKLMDHLDRLQASHDSLINLLKNAQAETAQEVIKRFAAEAKVKQLEAERVEFRALISVTGQLIAQIESRS